jgi:hypothetical protein
MSVPTMTKWYHFHFTSDPKVSKSGANFVVSCITVLDTCVQRTSFRNSDDKLNSWYCTLVQYIVKYQIIDFRDPTVNVKYGHVS